MEMIEIDLHGMTHEEAVLNSENFVLLQSQNELFECRLITGNSMKMQVKIMEMLEEHNFRWFIPTWNTGEIIVTN
jgi:DNA-nicking Smr family endonuclease|tara:strand:- start:47 stop:271 length:225 start_codon:yes stop_codon:yes gene_type:complete